MSYKGYVQAICENGHRYDFEAYESDAVCPVCKGRPSFENGVDNTNGCSHGHVLSEEWDRFLLGVETVVTCNLGHPHVVQHATYRIPTKEELKPLRCWCFHKGAGSGVWFRCATGEVVPGAVMDRPLPAL